MRKFLKDYLTFTRSETRIIFILSAILLFLVLIRFFSGTRPPKSYSPTDEELQLIREFIASFETDDTGKKDASVRVSKIYYDHLDRFNPNQVRENEMRDMGFPERVIHNVMKYRNSGGYFHSPDDFKKIYGLTDSAFRLIRPYIMLAEDVPHRISPVKDTIQTVFDKNIPVNINTADSIKLLSLKGIGPEFAARIIKFRGKLGGFVKSEQLLDVYGLSIENYNLFKERIYIDYKDIRKIDINNVSYYELIKHPYINEETAAAFIKFRDFRGRITDIRELYLYKVASEEILNRIESYLTVAEE